MRFWGKPSLGAASTTRWFFSAGLDMFKMCLQCSQNESYYPLMNCTYWLVNAVNRLLMALLIILFWLIASPINYLNAPWIGNIYLLIHAIDRLNHVWFGYLMQLLGGWMARLLLAICDTTVIVYLRHESYCSSAVVRILFASQPASRQPICYKEQIIMGYWFLGFLVSWFLGFFVSWFLSFLVSWCLGSLFFCFLVSKMLGFLV